MKKEIAQDNIFVKKILLFFMGTVIGCLGLVAIYVCYLKIDIPEDRPNRKNIKVEMTGEKTEITGMETSESVDEGDISASDFSNFERIVGILADKVGTQE